MGKSSTFNVMTKCGRFLDPPCFAALFEVRCANPDVVFALQISERSPISLSESFFVVRLPAPLAKLLRSLFPLPSSSNSATINPEESRVPIDDPRFDWLVEAYKPNNKVPAFLTCVDIAGLTAGAASGAGLGNAFLSHVRAVDGIFQLVRASIF